MFADEIRHIVVAAGVATAGTNFFNSSKAKVPIGTQDGPFLYFRETGGTSADKTHNSLTVPAYVRPGGRLLSVGKDVAQTIRQIRAAYLAVSVIRNSFVATATISITVSRVGTLVTAITATPHGWGSGYSITIAGANQAGYNGTFVITVVDDTTFTYVVAGSPTSPGTGPITASYEGTWYRRIDPLQEPFDLGVDSDGRVQFAFNFRADKTFS
jgi:hypothetical protein